MYVPITVSLALLQPRSPALASPPAWTASPRIARPAVMLAAPRDDSPSSLFSPESWTEKGFDGVQRLPAACRAAEATTAEAEHLALAFLSQDADSVVARTLSKAGSSAASLKRQLEDFSARQPKVKGAAPEQPSVGASLLALVRGANNERAALGDEFLSGDGAHSFRKPPDPSQTLPAPFPLPATPSPGPPTPFRSARRARADRARRGASLRPRGAAGGRGSAPLGPLREPSAEPSVNLPLQAEGLDAAKLRTAADEVRGGRKISSKDPEAAYEAREKADAAAWRSLPS